jgi:hypothetical protein
VGSSTSQNATRLHGLLQGEFLFSEQPVRSRKIKTINKKIEKYHEGREQVLYNIFPRFIV